MNKNPAKELAEKYGYTSKRLAAECGLTAKSADRTARRWKANGCPKMVEIILNNILTRLEAQS